MNVVETIMRELGICFSHTFVDRIYTFAPESDSLYGVQRALQKYGVETIGIHYNDKEEAGVTFPCVLRYGDGFVVGIDLNEDTIKYHDGENCKEESVYLFNDKWTGDSLLVTDRKKIKEPGYFKNKIADFENVVIRNFLFVLFAGIGMLGVVQPGISDVMMVNCLFDVLGLAICYMLFNEQLLGHSTLVDKVCSAIQKGGCDSILESADAKFFGLISWTEIGFAYFSSRLLCCYVNNGCLAILQMIGWIAMLYGIWSIWHQAFKAKRWCALCVSVQVIVWVCGIYNIFAFLAFDTSVGVVLTYVICVVFCLLVTHTLSEYFSIRNQYLHIGKDLVSLKMRDDIFNAAINGSSKIDVGDKDSSIYEST